MVKQDTLVGITFADFLKDHYSCQPIDALHGLREKAWNRFLELGLPQRKNEAFQYVSLSQLYDTPLTSAITPCISKESLISFIYPECYGSCLVFVNGIFQYDLSSLSSLPSSVVILPLADAMRTYAAFLQNRLANSLKEENDPFAVLNIAMHQSGAFIYVPPKVELEVPIQILHFYTADSPTMFLAMPRLHFFIGAHSCLKMLSRVVGAQSTSYCGNTVIDVALEEGSHFEMMQAFNAVSQSWHFEALRASLKRDSRFKSLAAMCQGKMVRQDYKLSLLGENAEAELKGISLLNGNSQSHTHVLMDHQAPHSQSMQHFKGILNDFSRLSFEGKILVRSLAQKTQAYQLNKNLLLSDKANVNSKPNLEIFADDVKASHGATVSYLDPCQLFYLNTRGLSSKEAATLLIEAFCREILELIPYRTLQEELIKFSKSFILCEGHEQPSRI